MQTKKFILLDIAIFINFYNIILNFALIFFS